MGILIGIALILYSIFDIIDVFTVLILPIQEHKIFFHFLVTCVSSFFNFLKISLSLLWLDIFLHTQFWGKLF